MNKCTDVAEVLEKYDQGLSKLEHYAAKENRIY